MATAIEKLPRLIARATAALEKATTAAEILEAQRDADVAYNAAKVAARLSKMKDAHDAILAACWRTQADALVIEARAQCRLADEYDAAQDRGEVKEKGKPRKNNVPNENIKASVTDIGLTRKQVHNARKVRDAEKAKPGIIRQMLDKQLEAGEEPTRAAVKRAIAPKKPKERAHKSDPSKQAVAASLALDKGFSREQIKVETGLGEHEIQLATERERGRRETAASIDPKILSMSAQEKLDTAIRQAKKKLEIEFEHRVLAECKERLNSISLPHYTEKLERLEKLIIARRGVMDKVTYNKIRWCLHSDHVQDATLKRRYDEAFTIFNDLEKLLLSEKESPTPFQPRPRNYDELMVMRAKMQAERRAKRDGKSAVSKR